MEGEVVKAKKPRKERDPNAPKKVKKIKKKKEDIEERYQRRSYNVFGLGKKDSGTSKSSGKSFTKEEGLFYFPQEESLRDPGLKYQCTMCVRGYNNSFHFKQHVR